MGGWRSPRGTWRGEGGLGVVGERMEVRERLGGGFWGEEGEGERSEAVVDGGLVELGARGGGS